MDINTFIFLFSIGVTIMMTGLNVLIDLLEKIYGKWGIWWKVIFVLVTIFLGIWLMHNAFRYLRE